MGRAPCCDKTSVKKGPWSPEEDEKLKSFIEKHGTGGNWIALPQKIGLKRCGKSCRLRWLNYLRPNIKHGGFSDEEDSIICSLYISIGSRWSIIAAHLPGRTDNDIKNHWNTKLKTRLLGKQRKTQQNRCLMMKYKAEHRQAPSTAASPQAVTNEASNELPWQDKPSNTSASFHSNHTCTDHRHLQASISKLQTKLTDVRFPCHGNGAYRVQVAPSLTIPQAIYESAHTVKNMSSERHENALNEGCKEFYEGYDLSYEMNSLISGNINVSESIFWGEMNSFAFPVAVESSYEEVVKIEEL